MSQSARTIAAQAKRLALFSAVSGFALACAPAASAQLVGGGDQPGGFASSRAFGVSADGRVIVGSSSTNDAPISREAVIWTPSGPVELGDFTGGAFTSRALAVSADGGVVVGFGTTVIGDEPFVWTPAGGLNPLAYTGMMDSGFARGVSADGTVIVGAMWSSAIGGSQVASWIAAGPGGAYVPLLHADLGGDSAAFGVSADGTTMVGGGVNATTGSVEAIAWTGLSAGGSTVQGLGILAGAGESRATAAGANGSVIVGYTSIGREEAFRWTGGVMSGLGLLSGGAYSAAYATNYDGSVVVGEADTTTSGALRNEAMIWTPAGGMRALSDVLAADGVNLGGWSLVEATGVSADGTLVVGEGRNPSRDIEAFWARLSIGALAPDRFMGLGAAPGGVGNAIVDAVSGNGATVVGEVSVGVNASEAYFWTPTGGLTRLGDLPGGATISFANDVSDDGTIVVGGGLGVAGSTEPVVWRSTVISALGPLPGAATADGVASGVSADGSVIVGYARNGSGNYEAFRWTAAGMSGLGTLGGATSDAVDVSDDGGVVVGSSSTAAGPRHAFSWQSGVMTDLGVLAGYQSSYANAVSGDGNVVVGENETAATTSRAFRWTRTGGIQPLPLLTGGTDNEANAVNQDGSVIVGWATTTGTVTGEDGFIWTQASGSASLTELARSQGVNLGTWILDHPRGVSDNGLVVVGNGTNPSGAAEGFWLRLTALPPPSGGGSGGGGSGGGGSGGGGTSPPPPPQTGGFLSSSVLAQSAISTGAATSAMLMNASLDGLMSAAAEGVRLRDGRIISSAHGRVQYADAGAVASDAATAADARGGRAGAWSAWALNGAHGYDGDVSDARAFDGTWGLSYQATDALRVGGGLRYTSYDGDLPVFNGDADVSSYALLGFAAYAPADAGLRVTLGGMIGRSEARIDRGYLNGIDPVTSSGERDGETAAVSAMAGWKLWLSDDAAVTPFVRYDATRFELDGYTETGGPFPAIFYAVDGTLEIGRVGALGAYALSPTLELRGSLALAHRGGDRLPAVSGQVIGLQGFNYAGAELDRDWAEAGAGLSWAARSGVDVRVGLGASTDGDTAPALSGTIGVEMRL